MPESALLPPPPGILTWAEVDLKAIAANVHNLKTLIGPQVEIIAVVKANGYGHGEVAVAKTALANGATRLAVHRMLDGVRLRQGGITAPILVLGYTPPSGLPMVIEHQLTQTVIDVPVAEALSRLATGPTPIHIKVDTGMSRYGMFPHQVIDFIRTVERLPHLYVEGVFSHFATADEAERGPMLKQWAAFRELLTALEAAGIEIPLRHICNSAATLTLPEARLDAVRPGLLLYGIAPTDAVPLPYPLQPALTLKSTVVQVKDLPAGSGIGYGWSYITERPIRTALVPIGYGDGYHRLISNRGAVLIHGQRAPIRGRVSMDQIVVEVSDIPDVAIGDEVVVLGAQGDERITAEEIARWAETIPYEVLTSIHTQIPRRYRSNGAVVQF